MAAHSAEWEKYQKFVDTTVRLVATGVSVDSGYKGTRHEIAKRLGNMRETVTSDRQDAKGKLVPIDSCERVLYLRFLLGEDDATYLQAGLSALCSTAPEIGHPNQKKGGIDIDLPLAPASLYTPDTAAGIRRGMLRALREKHREASNGAGPMFAAEVPVLDAVLQAAGMLPLESASPATVDEKRKVLTQLLDLKEKLVRGSGKLPLLDAVLREFANQVHDKSGDIRALQDDLGRVKEALENTKTMMDVTETKAEERVEEVELRERKLREQLDKCDAEKGKVRNFNDMLTRVKSMLESSKSVPDAAAGTQRAGWVTRADALLAAGGTGTATLTWKAMSSLPGFRAWVASTVGSAWATMSTEAREEAVVKEARNVTEEAEKGTNSTANGTNSTANGTDSTDPSSTAPPPAPPPGQPAERAEAERAEKEEAERAEAERAEKAKAERAEDETQQSSFAQKNTTDENCAQKVLDKFDGLQNLLGVERGRKPDEALPWSGKAEISAEFMDRIFDAATLEIAEYEFSEEKDKFVALEKFLKKASPLEEAGSKGYDFLGWLNAPDQNAVDALWDYLQEKAKGVDFVPGDTDPGDVGWKTDQLGALRRVPHDQNNLALIQRSFARALVKQEREQTPPAVEWLKTTAAETLRTRSRQVDPGDPSIEAPRSLYQAILRLLPYTGNCGTEEVQSKNLFGLGTIERRVQSTRSTGSSLEEDASVSYALLRGLVGQRGPTERARPAATTGGTEPEADPVDALLPYTLPDVAVLSKALPALRRVLELTDDPTPEELDAALAHAEAEIARAETASATTSATPAPKRQRVSLAAAPPRNHLAVAQSLEALGGNYAITGVAPVSEDDDRGGVEWPHEVRWVPQGPRGRTMAQVAVMEHLAARCLQEANRASPHISDAAREELHRTACALKLMQLEPLYELCLAAEEDDAPHPLGTDVSLVTRPLAVVRGTLCWPTEPGVEHLPEDCPAENENEPYATQAELKQMMAKTASATAAARNDRRARGQALDVYVAPPTSKIHYRAAPTGAGETSTTPAAAAAPDAAAPAAAAPAAGAAAAAPLLASASAPAASTPPPPRTSSVVFPSDLSTASMLRLVNRALYAVAHLRVSGGGGDPDSDPVDVFLATKEDEDEAMPLSNALTRRDGLWIEFHRHLSISHDKLWVFVRLLSGAIGGDVQEIVTMADDATLKASKAIQAQRVEIAKRVADTQSKIVEVVFASMLRESKLTLDQQDHSRLVVVDSAAQKELEQLATGANGKAFFGANVALKSLVEGDKTPATSLDTLLRSLATVGRDMQANLEQTLTQSATDASTLAELSHPSNSYFLSLRTDVTFAIRTAHEKLNAELVAEGCNLRSVFLWELVEGGSSTLTLRFAEFAGYLLVQTRSSTGVSALYVGAMALSTNSAKARVALAHLVSAARAYLRAVPYPWAGKLDDANAVRESRADTLAAGERIGSRQASKRTGCCVSGPASLYAPIPATGWYVR